MLKLKLQYFGHLMRRVDSLEKTDAGRDWRQEEKGTTEDEMAGRHHWLYGRESEWTLGVCDGQEAWRAVIHGVAKSRTRLSDWTELIYILTPFPNFIQMMIINVLKLVLPLLQLSLFIHFTVPYQVPVSPILISLILPLHYHHLFPILASVFSDLDCCLCSPVYHVQFLPSLDCFAYSC